MQAGSLNQCELLPELLHTVQDGKTGNEQVRPIASREIATDQQAILIGCPQTYPQQGKLIHTSR